MRRKSVMEKEMENCMEANRKREGYLDLIRVVAIILVLYAHSSSYGAKLYYASTTTVGSLFYISLDCFRTINNALFFMISGALLYDCSVFDRKYLKRILRIGILFLAASVFQYAWKQFTGEFSNGGLKDFIIRFYTGNVHYSYWFMYTYIAFLLMLPFFQHVAQHMTKKHFYYLIVICVLFTDVFPCLQGYFGVGGIAVSPWISIWNYSAQSLLGYYLHKHMKEILTKQVLAAWTFAAIVAVACATLLTYRTGLLGEYTEAHLSRLNVLTMVAVYMWLYVVGGGMQENDIIYPANRFRVGVYNLLIRKYDREVRWTKTLPNNWRFSWPC